MIWSEGSIKLYKLKCERREQYGLKNYSFKMQKLGHMYTKSKSINKADYIICGAQCKIKMFPQRNKKGTKI